mmetsp:Transcript_232/g.227  ORF Transcript_232/g.227 Transcript_232/m.227 type:complete len:167 (-) Transcript_232:62-562(-)|eukprot:CAMPEP_0205822378 /NCGR_PEP_ID=MMETSP0206-20130828/12240_1 /ASSEMBLY_ACC=CAM_ASM_000279 /TAXON_ID=36767 /ORGANISM="Euplotes focardii, Strain TN1" /LENGTH=166 /DNA_ID=CAMNT_0053118599 /DNA_START=24 /DNA_END=524 /DNA_ORIENTATION=+
MFSFKALAFNKSLASKALGLGKMSVIRPNMLTSVLSRSYHENVIDHYEKPRNVGSLDAKDQDVGTGLVGAPACGDVMKLQIKVNKDNNKIEKAVFKTFGCGSAIASSSYATEILHGMDLDDAMNIRNKDISDHLKLPPVKLHCSMLAEDAIKAAVRDYKKKFVEAE